MTITRRLSLSLAVASALAVASTSAHASPRVAAMRSSSATPREPARAFLKLDAHLDRPKRALYVGQAVPIAIHAYFFAGTGVTMNGLPRVTSDSFELSDLSATPRQSQAEVRGLPYTMLTWNGVLTAVKEGPAKTDIELPVSLSYREAPRARARDDAADPNRERGSGDDDQTSDDPFAALLRQSPIASDPFFAQMFKGGDPFHGMFADLGGAVRQRDVTLRDTTGVLTVAALPPNRPADFTGAVGSFEIGAALGDEPLRVGEPATLTLTVHGKGSFSRLALSGLKPSDSLNAYGVTSTFKPGAAPLSGEKVFKQTIVPRRDGATTLPAATLTYFDPVERRYVSRHTPPMSVTVATNAGDEAHASTPTPTLTKEAVAATYGTNAVDSIPDVTRTSLTPVIRTRAFWAMAIAIGFVSAGVAAFGYLRRRGALARVAASRRVRREIAAWRRSMSAAADRGDAAAMFTAGRAALQARLGATWGLPSEAIAAADVAARLGARGDRICEVFDRADRLTYSRARTTPPEDLSRWQGVITDALGSLEVTS